MIMEKISLKDVVLRLVGEIHPVGESYEDKKRFENLKSLCELVEELVCEIDRLSCDNKNDYRASVSMAGRYADNFIEKNLGIKD